MQLRDFLSKIKHELNVEFVVGRSTDEENFGYPGMTLNSSKICERFRVTTDDFFINKTLEFTKNPTKVFIMDHMHAMLDVYRRNSTAFQKCQAWCFGGCNIRTLFKRTDVSKKEFYSMMDSFESMVLLEQKNTLDKVFALTRKTHPEYYRRVLDVIPEFKKSIKAWNEGLIQKSIQVFLNTIGSDKKLLDLDDENATIVFKKNMPKCSDKEKERAERHFQFWLELRRDPYGTIFAEPAMIVMAFVKKMDCIKITKKDLVISGPGYWTSSGKGMHIHHVDLADGFSQRDLLNSLLKEARKFT